MCSNTPKKEETKRVNSPADTMLQQVVDGLSQPQKRLPSKYLYDQRGSELFEKITDQKEYYLTRTETKILEENIDEITETLGTDIALIELGSGSSSKTRLLLGHLPNIHSYIPVDISEDFLSSITEQLSCDYPQIHIQPIAADYTTSFNLPDDIHDVWKVVFFPGSTIGNFTPERASKFLKMTATIAEDDGGMLIGVDLKKDKKLLEAAYNDASGVTAAFNKNILRHINYAANADFNIDRFEHKAIFNEREGRIEMHLISTCVQKVQVGTNIFSFQEGETIHTENSYKYSIHEFEELIAHYYQVKKIWTDENELFSIWYIER